MAFGDVPIELEELLMEIGDPEGELEVLNPADATHVAQVKAYSAAEVEREISQMTLAWPSWRSQSAKERARYLKVWNDLILAHSESLAMLVTLECGKPLAEARGEVAYAAAFIEWFAEEAKRAYGDVIPAPVAGKNLFTLRQPVGVAAAITPWNFPLAMITRKAGPALAAGCPMIVKPAEATPLSALALEWFARKAGIPGDVFKVVPTIAPAEIGDVFTRSSDVRKLSFTGSTSVGKILLEKCASTVKRVSMELGGNAPFIVFDDADLNLAIEGALASKFRNAGQTCVCANRFLVQDGIHDAFVHALVERASQLRVGRGDAGDVQIGPIINETGAQKIEVLVRAAVDSGALVECGGGRHSAGRAFFEPTVLTGVCADMAIFNTEIFGPVASITKFSTEADAIELANATPYGLAAYFFTEDRKRISRLNEALEYGMVGANDGMISTEVAPFGGIKESGLGREGARQGLEEYLEIKYVSVGGL
jgi:succinate-semialdehyde dehydrogenase / glutarate-semialdehyde dehydrogenase